ncbi:MAG: siderophore-interacting protein [Nannocystaceae bacterium]|nr:siderophore-interacting protein [Nannocystaceae bacterium]
MDEGWDIGDRVMIDVGSGVHRQYTICRLHRPRGVFDILAVAHGAGPGGRWVRTVEKGDSLKLFGPKPDLDVRTAGVRNLILLGDETTVGLYEAVHRVRRGPVKIWGALEHSEAVELHACELPVLSGLERIPRNNALPGDGLNRWIREHDIYDPKTVFFVNGHGAAVRSLRLALLSMGIRGVAIRSRAFWGRI